jgi:hypothetical protein
VVVVQAKQAQATLGLLESAFFVWVEMVETVYLVLLPGPQSRAPAAAVVVLVVGLAQHQVVLVDLVVVEQVVAMIARHRQREQ